MRASLRSREARVKALLLLFCLCAAQAEAHPLAPALLELREVAPARYAVLWRTSVARAQLRMVEPRLPSACVLVAPPETRVEAGEALVARWVVQCGATGLAGETLSVDGLAESGINVIVRIEDDEGRVLSRIIDASEPRWSRPGSSDLGKVPWERGLGPRHPIFSRYLALGVEHLLTGLDHLLFLLGLFLLVPGFRSLVATVTAFSAGHCATLSLATLGLLPVKQGPAELAIAATVLLLACELARPKAAAPGARTLLRRRPWFMAGIFGLVHGLGFAGALREIGLPPDEIPLSLLAFNIGIETAQLALVALMLAAAIAWRRSTEGLARAPQLARVLPSYLVGSMAAFWCLERSWILFT